MTLRRDWHDAREKIDHEGRCRVCGDSWALEAAHTVGRARDERQRGASIVHIDPNAVLPLCQRCHQAYDAGRLNLLGFLTLDEELCAVRAAGGLEAARRRIIGSEAFRREAA